MRAAPNQMTAAARRRRRDAPGRCRPRRDAGGLGRLWWCGRAGRDASDVADGERDVRQRIDQRPERVQLKVAEFGAERHAVDGVEAMHERFAGKTMLDDLVDRAHLERVGGAERGEIGETGHFAVVAHNFDDDGGGREAGEATEIDGANEHAAIARAERVDVPRAHEVGG
jgi:hypothetical protein